MTSSKRPRTLLPVYVPMSVRPSKKRMVSPGTPYEAARVMGWPTGTSSAGKTLSSRLPGTPVTVTVWDFDGAYTGSVGVKYAVKVVVPNGTNAGAWKVPPAVLVLVDTPSLLTISIVPATPLALRGK